MNKKKLLKTIMITFLIVVGLSWIISAGSFSDGTYSVSGIEPLGLWDLFYYPAYSFSTFVQYGLLILVIGGFYGVLAKTGVYNNIVKRIAKKFKDKRTV